MKNKIIFLFTLLFLLFVKPSYSLEDFNGYLNKELIEICECSDYYNKITIKNIGDELSNYKIDVEGALKENVVLSKKAFSLSPNEMTDINYALAKTCGKIGKYELVFDIISQSIVKRMSVPVSIKKCININLATKKNVEIICPCALVKYQLELKNIGNFSENYLINVNRPFKKWSKLKVKEITLAPGQETILDFYLRPDCAVYGNYSAVFKVTAEKTNLAAKMPLYLYILPCYDYNITLGDYYTVKEEAFLFKEYYGDYELCEKEEKIIPVLIENKAPIPNKYYLTLEADDWAKLERGKAIINAKNSTIVHLVVKPPEKLRENYTFLLEARTHWGNLKQKREFNVSVDWYYTPFIKTDRINVNYTKSTKQIEIQNQGVKEADYSFEIIEKPEWARVEPLNITVLPNETKVIKLISEPSEEIKQGNYNLVINTTAQNNVGYEHLIIIQLKKKSILGKAYDYLKQKIIFVYEKIKGLAKDYVWYLLLGLAGLIVLIVFLSLIRKTFIKRKERKEEEEIEEEVKEVVEKEEPKVRKPKIRLWKYLAVFIILIILFIFSYTLIPEVFKGNFTAITTIYPGYPKEEINITEVPVEEPEELPTLKEKICSYGKSLTELLKSYSYYIGFGILVLIFLIIVIRFVRKKRHEELEIKEKIKEKPIKEKKEEIKKIVKKKKKKKTDFYYILKILLLALVAAIFIFAISYFRNYFLFFINYIIGGVAALVLLILIATLSKKKKIRKQFKKKWKSYFLILILILILFGIYFSYKNKYYEMPYNKTKEWVFELLKIKNITYVPLIENISEEEKEVVGPELEEVAEEIEEGIVISWEQNSERMLDLKQYFHDPDNDILYFSSSQLENISVEINEEGIVILKPKGNWYGTEKVVFTADDNKGGVIESDEILLVVEKTDKSFLEKIKDINLITKTKNFLSIYSVYIVSGLIILVIVLFFLRRGEKKNKKKKNYK